jgi:hypothetical protein
MTSHQTRRVASCPAGKEGFDTVFVH